MSAARALQATRYAVVGFGDFPMADALTPAVTVIDQDPAALGSLAAERIINRIDHPHRRYRRTTVLPVRLIERGSCQIRPGHAATAGASGA
jgi:LacI family transcriptional regulator, galactose operon repressor